MNCLQQSDILANHYCLIVYKKDIYGEHYTVGHKRTKNTRVGFGSLYTTSFHFKLLQQLFSFFMFFLYTSFLFSSSPLLLVFPFQLYLMLRKTIIIPFLFYILFEYEPQLSISRSKTSNTIGKTSFCNYRTVLLLLHDTKLDSHQNPSTPKNTDGK